MEGLGLPGITRESGELLRQREDLNLCRDRHLEERIDLTMPDEAEKSIGRGHRVVKEGVGVVRVEVFSVDL